MIYVHRYRGILPKGRADLFNEVIQVLFSRRKGYLPQLTPGQKQSILQPLAYEMMLERKQSILTKDASQIVKPILNSFSTRVPGAAFLQAVESSAGLIREEDNRSYRFAHLTFQEYLTAVYAKENHLEQELVDHVADEWWHETISLYAAQTDASWIIRACLADGRLSELTFQLALNCLEETPMVSPKIKPRLEKVIKRCLADPELTHVVTNAFAEIRKNRMVRISANKFIDPKLISHGEYQVFLHEKQQNEEAYQPDHWLYKSFPNNLANDPIVGIRPEDAESFCNWLTKKEGKGYWRFRLPKLTELMGQGLFGLEIEGNANYWVRTRGNYECLGILRPKGLNGNEAKQNLLQDTKNHPQYDIKQIFPNGSQLVDLPDIEKYLSPFDFSQRNSRNLVDNIRTFGNYMQPEANSLMQLLEPLAQFFDQEEIRYRDACQQIVNKINNLQSQIENQKKQLAEAHRNISANFNILYGKIQQVFHEYNESLNQQKSQYQEIQSNEQEASNNAKSQFDTILSSIQKQVNEAQTWAESEKQRIKLHYESNYNILDQNISSYKAEINKLEGLRGQYTDESINEGIKQYNDALSKIEKDRRELNSAEQNNYREISSQLGTEVSSLESKRKEIEKQFHQVREQIQKQAKENYAIIEKNIKQIEAQLAELKKEEKQLKWQEQKEKNTVSDQANQNISVIQDNINILTMQQAEYTSNEQLFRQNALTIRSSLKLIAEKLNSIMRVLKSFDAFFANYFDCDTHETGQLKVDIEAIGSHLNKLITFSQEYIQQSQQGPLVDYLQNLISNTQNAMRNAHQLYQIINNSVLLGNWLISGHKSFQGLEMGNLPSPLSITTVDQRIYKSLEFAYSYLRYHRRKDIRKANKTVVAQQLHYIRLCILATISSFMTQHPIDGAAGKILPYIHHYIATQILEARIQGREKAFEGIRLIKEHVASN